MPAWFYVLRLKSGNLYIGSTCNLQNRLNEHLRKHACMTTKIDSMIKLVYSEEFQDISSARKRESQVKKWTRAKKEALVSCNIAELKRLSIPRNKNKI